MVLTLPWYWSVYWCCEGYLDQFGSESSLEARSKPLDHNTRLMCFSPSLPPHRYAPEERKREMKAGNSSSFNINTIWSKETKSYLSSLYFEKVEDARWLLEGVRLAKLIQLCKSSLQVTVGTKTNAHCNSLIDTTYRNHKKTIKMSKCETNNMYLCFRYLSFDSIIVSCCQ